MAKNMATDDARSGSGSQAVLHRTRLLKPDGRRMVLYRVEVGPPPAEYLEPGEPKPGEAGDQGPGREGPGDQHPGSAPAAGRASAGRGPGAPEPKPHPPEGGPNGV